MIDIKNDKKFKYSVLFKCLFSLEKKSLIDK